MKLKGRKVTKVLFRGKKGVTIFYKAQRPKGIPENGSFTIGADPFDDLKNAKDALKRHFLKVCGLNSVSLMTGSDALTRKMNEKEIKAFEKSTATAQIKNLDIIGLTLAYDDDKLVRTKLLGMYANEKGEVFSINAPLVHLNRENYYGIESDLERDILKLVEEVEGFDAGRYTMLEEPEEAAAESGTEEDEEESEEATDEVNFDDEESSEQKGASMKLVKTRTKKRKAA
mgnify:CR=1 FL=1